MVGTLSTMPTLLKKVPMRARGCARHSQALGLAHFVRTLLSEAGITVPGVYTKELWLSDLTKVCPPRPRWHGWAWKPRQLPVQLPAFSHIPGCFGGL